MLKANNKVIILLVLSCQIFAADKEINFSALQNKANSAQQQLQLKAIIEKIKNMQSNTTNEKSMQGDDLEDQAFLKTKDALFPLTPKQIKSIRYQYNETKQASSVTEKIPAKPVASAISVNLAPGATPPVIRLSAGFVSSLIFLDSTGAPWPIKAYDIGDPQSFNVQWIQGTPAEEKAGQSMGNAMLIQPSTMYKQGNLAVMLKGLNTPVMITLIPGQRVVDYRVDIQVPGAGPMANAAAISHMPVGANPDLLSVLNNIAPHGAKSLQVEGGEAQAWVKGKTMYIRTPLTLVSPSWISTMSSSDGLVRVYTCPVASSLLAMYHGKVINLSVKGF